jgi:hypothetical protein
VQTSTTNGRSSLSDHACSHRSDVRLPTKVGELDNNEPNPDFLCHDVAVGEREESREDRAGHFMAGDGSRHWTTTPPRTGWSLNEFDEWVGPPRVHDDSGTSSRPPSLWDGGEPTAWEPTASEVFGDGGPAVAPQSITETRRWTPALLARWVGGCVAALVILVALRLVIPGSEPDPLSPAGGVIDQIAPGMGGKVIDLNEGVERQQSLVGGTDEPSLPASTTLPVPVPSVEIRPQSTVAIQTPGPAVIPGNPNSTIADVTAPSPESPIDDSIGPFGSCSAARAAGAAPLYAGDPGYSPSLDRDRDGAACE